MNARAGAAARLAALTGLAAVALLVLVALPVGLVLGGRPAELAAARMRALVDVTGRVLDTPLSLRERAAPRDAAWLLVHAVAGVLVVAVAVLLGSAAAGLGGPVLAVVAVPVLAGAVAPPVLRRLAALARDVLVVPGAGDEVRGGVTRLGAALLLGPAALLLLAATIGGLLLAPVLGAGLPVVARAMVDTRRFVAFTGRLLGTPAVRAYASSPGPTWSALGAAVRDRQNLRDVGWLGVHGALGALAYLAGAMLIRMAVNLGAPSTIPPLVTLATLLIVVLAVALILRVFALLAGALIATSPSEALARRVTELAESRAATVDAQAAELRRIERDLHDGAQARLAAVRMTLGLASQTLHSDVVRTAALLAEARDDAGRALSELRDLVRGIHPPVLADRGLAGGLAAAGLLCPVPVDLQVRLPGRPLAPVESAVYFAAAEALANIGRHSGAQGAWLRVDHVDGVLRVVVGDNGRGGADPRRGSGLRGIERRLAAFDGTLTVTSPAGGPTELTMEVPCQLNSVSSSPRTTSC